MKSLKIKSLLFCLVSLPGFALAQTDELAIDGFTEPYRSIDVAAPQMGTISEIAVQEGDRVSAGRILAKLNEQVLLASLTMAQESKDARGKLNSAMAEQKMQQQRLEKLLGLQKRQHASQIEIDRATAQLEVATAQVEAVQDEYRIKACEVKRIEAQLEQRRLRSPIDGIITSISKDQGEFVSANDPVVLNVVQLDPLLVIFSVPQQHAHQIVAGQQLPVSIGEDHDSTKGTVEFVSPTADAQSGTCRVKIRIPNPGYHWRSGEVCQLETSAIAKYSSTQPKRQIADTSGLRDR